MILNRILPMLLWFRLPARPDTSFPCINGGSVLLIAGCRAHDFDSVIEQVTDGLPDSPVTLLAKEEMASACESDPRVNKFIPYPYEGFMSAGRVGEEFFRDIRREKYRLALVAYNNYSGKYCLNLERFGRACGALRLMGFYRSGHIFDLSAKAWKINMLHRMLEWARIWGWKLTQKLFYGIFSLLSLFHKTGRKRL